MQFQAVNALAEKYREASPQLDKTIHPNDDMFRKALKGWPDYEFVGRSTVDWITRALLFAKLEAVGSILDFGCGHGRCARHLRLAFPDAKISFSDIDEEAWRFCASQFGGDGFPAMEAIDELQIPGSYDLIFVGSVFTHLDWQRSVALWRKLFAALNRGGALVSTFHGIMLYRIMVRDADRLNQGGYYNPMLDDFRATGFGYQDYNGYTNWGQNLFTVGKIAELAQGEPNSALVCYAETAWANFHDLAVWSRA